MVGEGAIYGKRCRSMQENFKTGAVSELIEAALPSKGCSVRIHGKEDYEKKDKKKKSE